MEEFRGVKHIRSVERYVPWVDGQVSNASQGDCTTVDFRSRELCPVTLLSRNFLKIQYIFLKNYPSTKTNQRPQRATECATTK